METKFVKLAILTLIFFSLQGCLLNPWSPLYAEDSIKKLERDFIYIEEMTFSSGITRTAGWFGEEYKIKFELPETLAPEDWLTYLVFEINELQEGELKKSTDLYYFESYRDLGANSDRNRRELSYLESEEVYLARYYYND